MKADGWGIELYKGLRRMAFIFVGLAVGLVSGLLGVGGGILLVPALAWLFGIRGNRGHGTSLAAIAPVAFITALFYAHNGHMDWLAAILLAIGGIIGAAIGAKVGREQISTGVRRYAWIAVGLIGLGWIVQGIMLQSGRIVPMMPEMPTASIAGVALMVVVGTVVGILSGMFGIGGGILLVPALVFFGFPQVLAEGVSIAVVFPASFSGALIHAKQGNVNGNAALWLAVGGIIGGLIGAHFAFHWPVAVLRGLFGLLMVVAAVLMGRERIAGSEEAGSR